MIKKFIPSYYAENIFTINYSLLKNNNIINLFFDLDNTLSAYSSINPDEKTLMLIKKLKTQGFNIFVISNNNDKRVNTFVLKLEVVYLANAKKPSSKRMKKFIMDLDLDIKQSILIGDQILTDVICANNLNMSSILVEPFVKKDLLITRLNRLIDKIIRKRLRKKRLLTTIEKE